MNEAQFFRSLAALPRSTRTRFFALVDAQLAPSLAPVLHDGEKGLFELPWPARGEPAWQAVFDARLPRDALSIVASPFPLAVVSNHLAAAAAELMPEDPWRLLEGWHVDVLRALLRPAQTYGAPSLTTAQRAFLLSACLAWWFCADDGTVCMVAGTAGEAASQVAQCSLPLTSAQVDALLDACQPARLARRWRRFAGAWSEALDDAALHRLVQTHWREARALRLMDVRPMEHHVERAVRYAALLRRSAAIRDLMERVHEGRLGVAQAMQRFPRLV